MQLDPTRWLVSLAGFIYDWIITREWKRILLALIPVMLLLIVASLVWWGKNLNRRQLASWYRQLGDTEIVDWQNSWAGADAAKPATPEPETETEVQDVTEVKQEKQVSRYAEMLFRRVQLLDPSEHSQFVIGATMAQRGALAQAQTMLAKVAPDEQSGYAPAHAYLARIYLDDFRKKPTMEMAKVLKHHILEAKRWPRVPNDLLRAGSDLFWMTGDRSESLNMLSRAAESDPGVNLELAKRAKAMDNQRVLEEAVSKAEKYYLSQLTENPKDDISRVKLAELYAIVVGNLDAAEQLLLVGKEIEMTPAIARGLSEIYRTRFGQSMVEFEGKYSANIPMLEKALRYDSTNPMVFEEIAKLARLQGLNASQEMIHMLYEYLAEGKATAATHAWLAEVFLLRNEFVKALPHLEQVVIRLPTASQYLNNLAFVIADLHPEKLEEALAYAQRSVVAAAATQSPNADYYDTLGMILAKLDRNPEAIAAYETAIELRPDSKDFHRSVASVYRKQGNAIMADNHEKVIAAIETRERDAAAAEKAAVEQRQREEEVAAAEAAAKAKAAAANNSPPAKNGSL